MRGTLPGVRERRPEPPSAAPAGAGPAAPPSWWDRLRDRDHTRGSLLVSIAVLSLPSALTSVAGLGLLQLVDLLFLGRLGPAAIAAAGATNQTLRQLFFLIVFGITVASQMMIARLVGESNVEGAEHVAGQTLVLGFGVAVFCAFVGGLFPGFLVSLVARDPEVIALGTIYLRITFLMLAATVFVQLFGSILTGAGDTTTPLVITLATAPVTLLLEWALAFGRWGLPALGIAGVALGAGLGGLVGVAISFWALFSGRCRVHVRRRHVVPDLAVLRRLLAVSWQPALHMIARTAIVMFFMLLAGRLGGEVQAAYTIGLRLEMLPIMIAFPLANACATLVGQNLGAGDLRRCWGSIRVSFGVGIGLLWPAALGIFLYRHALVGVFTRDPVVAALAAEYLIFSSAALVLYAFYFVAFRALQAAGDMNSPMVISVSVALLIGAPLGYYLSTQSGLGATGMWVANLTYAVINSVLMVGWLLVGRWAQRSRPLLAGG